MLKERHLDVATALLAVLALTYVLAPRGGPAAVSAGVVLYAIVNAVGHRPEARHVLRDLARRPRPPLPHLLLFLAVLAGLLPFSPDVKAGLLSWLRLILFFGTSFLMPTVLRPLAPRPPRTGPVLHAILLGSTADACCGLFQAVTTRHLHVAGVSAPYVWFGALMAQAVLLALALLLAERRPPWRAAYAGVVCVCGAALLCSEARGPWLALALAGPVVVALSRRSLAEDRRWATVCLGGAAALVLGLAPAYGRHLLTVFDPTWESNWERTLIWKSTLHMIRDHPWVGVGEGRFAAVYNAHYLSPASVERWHPHAHDSFLQVAAEDGLLGLAASLFLLYGVGLFLRGRLREAPRSPYTIGTAGVFCALLVGSVVDLFLFSGFVRSEWLLWLLLGLEYADSPVRSDTPSGPPGADSGMKFAGVGVGSAAPG